MPHPEDLLPGIGSSFDIQVKRVDTDGYQDYKVLVIKAPGVEPELIGQIFLEPKNGSYIFELQSGLKSKTWTLGQAVAQIVAFFLDETA